METEGEGLQFIILPFYYLIAFVALIHSIESIFYGFNGTSLSTKLLAFSTLGATTA
jgi:hypothetical protein